MTLSDRDLVAELEATYEQLLDAVRAGASSAETDREFIAWHWRTSSLLAEARQDVDRMRRNRTAGADRGPVPASRIAVGPPVDLENSGCGRPQLSPIHGEDVSPLPLPRAS